jgi:hypothetical protein
MSEGEDRNESVEATDQQDELALEQQDLEVDPTDASNVTGGATGCPDEGGQFQRR